jgi:hypothetical protein
VNRKIFTVWYRATGPDGAVLCECSNPAEVLQLTENDDRTLEVFITYTVSDGWQPWDGIPVVRR